MPVHPQGLDWQASLSQSLRMDWQASLVGRGSVQWWWTGGALEMCEEDVLSEASKQDLSSFLARVDEIGTWSFCLLASYIFVTTLELGFIHGSNATINASGDLVRGLSASNDKTAADDAINKADAYLHSSKASESTIGFNQTVVNTPTTGSTQAKPVQSSQQGQYHYVTCIRLSLMNQPPFPK